MQLNIFFKFYDRLQLIYNAVLDKVFIPFSGMTKLGFSLI